MSEDTNALPDDDEAQRLLDELAAADAAAEPAPEPKATRKKASRKKATKPKDDAPTDDAPKEVTITNRSPRVLNIMHATLAPGGEYTITEQDAENDRFMRKVARAIELSVVK